MSGTSNRQFKKRAEAAQLAIGIKVRWTSSGTVKVGSIIAVVPAGKLPREVGFPKLGEGYAREHESYVVAARKPKHGPSGPVEGAGRKANYWPVVSLLQIVEGGAA